MEREVRDAESSLATGSPRVGLDMVGEEVLRVEEEKG